MNRRLRNGGPRPWSASANMPGLEPGYKPLAEILKQRVMEQMAKPGVVYPARTEIETELARNSNYMEGIAALLAEVQTDRLAGALQQAESAAHRI